MSSILYYSKFCSSSGEVLNKFAKSKIKDEFHFVCIDRRVKDKNGQTFVILENESKIILPDIVQQVPTVIKLNDDNKIYRGAKEIIEHFQPRENEINDEATMSQGEPTAFSMTEMSGASDPYSYLNMTFEEAKRILSYHGDMLKGMEHINDCWNRHAEGNSIYEDDDEFFAAWEYEVNAYNVVYATMKPLFAGE